jgi:hypothetical protein
MRDTHFFFLVSAIAIVCVTFVLLFAPDIAQKDREEPTFQKRAHEHITARFYRIDWDGHSWVYVDVPSGGDQFTHHPDCACSR